MTMMNHSKAAKNVSVEAFSMEAFCMIYLGMYILAQYRVRFLAKTFDASFKESCTLSASSHIRCIIHYNTFSFVGKAPIESSSDAV